ncbi:ABC transporter, permease [Deferribacter desulfuricans SSM1]|uniref:ABC transporter, permease n=1 Tax=Deferribacter desulfuricans (strain DSM 14783 / JCM 11476 / NBRC 101012 / SSM1) TaxID=639282 RepID=D3PEE4_DEFDS|nr:ABC transporter permease [Deferribacter desulfuricans]BAI80967.1 ABC transporter, permease [Deferribacter desulfuricans SSM1]
MSFYAFLGALEQGVVFAIMALGVYLTFRVLDFPDLSVDGTFPLGAAVSAALIVKGVNPFVSVFIAMLAGGIAGSVTALLNTKLKILHLLAGILTMIALYSVNLRIMGQPTVALLGYDTIFTPFQNMFGVEKYIITPIIFSIILIVIAIMLIWFLHTDLGLAMRATGDNQKMVKAQGVNTDRMILFGVATSNALVALSGALVAQSQGSADVNMGIGTIVAGLASVILGEAILEDRTVVRAVIAVIIGSILYRFAIAIALSFRIGSFQMSPSDLNLITAIIVTVALIFPGIRKKIGIKL